MSEPGPAAAGNLTLHDVAGHLPGRILGIDAGGSGTRVILLQIIEAADATAAGIGMPGVRQADQARDLSETLTRQTGCPVHVTGDADSARAGAFLGAPGVVVIAGTGSMA